MRFIYLIMLISALSVIAPAPLPTTPPPAIPTVVTSTFGTASTYLAAPKVFPEMEFAQEYCGPQLVRTIGIICKQRYYQSVGGKALVARGIIEECCKKPCTLDQLRLYCL